jgi:Mn-containing catalase
VVYSIPNSFPQDQENRDFSYALLGFQSDGRERVQGRWSSGQSIGGNDAFSSRPMEPLGEAPNPGRAREGSGAQAEQL